MGTLRGHMSNVTPSRASLHNKEFGSALSIVNSPGQARHVNVKSFLSYQKSKVESLC